MVAQPDGRKQDAVFQILEWCLSQILEALHVGIDFSEEAAKAAPRYAVQEVCIPRPGGT